MNFALPAQADTRIPHHLLAGALLIAVPAFVGDHSALLVRRLDYQILAAAFAAAYLLCAGVLAWRARQRARLDPFEALVFAAAFLCPIVIAIAVGHHSPAGRLPNEFGRRDLLSASSLMLTFTVLLSGWKVPRRTTLVVLALATIALLAGLGLQYEGFVPGSRAYEVKQQQVVHKRIDAPFYSLDVTLYRNFIDEPVASGGGLARFGDETLLATGDGALYLLADGGKPIRKLALRVPIDRNGLVADRPSGVEVTGFRVTDILVREASGRATLFAAYHVWNREHQCFNLRVSQIEGDAQALRNAGAAAEWRPLYNTAPCLRIEDVLRKPYTGFMEAGGRLALIDDRHLLLTIGDHEFDGLHNVGAIAQQSGNPYGKTVLIDLADGSSTPYTMGHRDPQGLWIDRDGSVWSTEHGPQGGDELNRLLPGRNYGWPSVTLGTEYGATTWPPSAHQGAHEGYEAPFFAWTPSIGISNLIRLDGRAFPLWRGDLLVGSLRSQSLWRVRLEGERVLYAAPIRLGVPVRDLEEDAKGRLLVWTDHEILAIQPATSIAQGEVAAAPCLQCHTFYADRSEHGVGPNLLSVVGRRVASAPGFQYSQSLERLGGKWDRRRLDAFIANPAGYAHGNAMHFPGISDPQLRQQIIDYLEARTR